MSSFTDTLLVEAAKGAAQTPAVRQNRARAAVAVHLGYNALDTYSRYRTSLFVLGLIGSGASGYLLWKRKNAEARALYGITGVLSLITAWVTRPDAFRSAPPPPPEGVPAPGPGAVAGAVGWMDARAERLAQEQPGWEGATWQRLAQDLGSGTMNPAVAALLTQGTL